MDPVPAFSPEIVQMKYTKISDSFKSYEIKSKYQCFMGWITFYTETTKALASDIFDQRERVTFFGQIRGMTVD